MLVFGHVHTWIIELLGYELQLSSEKLGCNYHIVLSKQFYFYLSILASVTNWDAVICFSWKFC